MRCIAFILLVSVQLCADPISIPKEVYLTYQQFKIDQAKKDAQKPIKAPENWVELKVSPPILHQYQTAENEVVSISVFEGNIGDDKSNINRWRRQLMLDPITDESVSTFLTNDIINQIPVKIINLNNSKQYFLIYWFSLNSKHIFVKIVSPKLIDKRSFDMFVTNQEWDQL